MRVVMSLVTLPKGRRGDSFFLFRIAQSREKEIVVGILSAFFFYVQGYLILSTSSIQSLVL